jgi:sugar O-acyltransferase (sialic acid O-acetyltransferase NeuD family)
MRKKIALIGYSGHAFVVAEAVELAGDELIGYYDRERADNNPFELPYLGFEGNTGDLTKSIRSGYMFIVGIGDNKLRKRLYQQLALAGMLATVVVHPESIVSPKALVGRGSYVGAGAKLNILASVGEGVILNSGCIVEHECAIGNFVHIAPGAVLAGSVKVGDETFIGAGAVVKQGVRIGSNVTIGAGAVVLKDIPDNQVWFGNPARPYIP